MAVKTKRFSQKNKASSVLSEYNGEAGKCLLLFFLATFAVPVEKQHKYTT